MAKENLIGIIMFLFIIGLCCSSLSLAEDMAMTANNKSTLSEKEKIFEKRLSEVLLCFRDPDTSKSGADLFAEKLDKMIHFALEYPSSPLAKDAQYLGNLLPLLGLAAEGNKGQAAPFIEAIKEITKHYPDGRLEELSCRKSVEILGDRLAVYIYIPFKDILVFIDALMASSSKDYETAVRNYLLLKNNLDFSRDITGNLCLEIYFPLAMFYMKLNKLIEADNIAKEAMSKFPYNEQIKKYMGLIINKISSP